MERGLLWLPLLAIFTWLAITGKKEYEKLENYKIWAEQFEKSKYDIYAVLGKKGSLITWGKPTPKGIINEQTFSLETITAINLTVNNQVIDINNYSNFKEGNLQFLSNDNKSIDIPFTDINIAVQWLKYLQTLI